MNYAGFMRSRQRVSKRYHPIKPLAYAERAFFKMRFQRLTANVLHCDTRRFRNVENLVDRNDVGVVKRGGSLCFLNESTLTRRVGDIRAENLNRQNTVEQGISGL